MYVTNNYLHAGLGTGLAVLRVKPSGNILGSNGIAKVTHANLDGADTLLDFYVWYYRF